MRQQVRPVAEGVAVGQVLLAGAVVAGFVVFDAVECDRIRERQQKMIRTIVPVAVERRSLGDEVLETGNQFGVAARAAALSAAASISIGTSLGSGMRRK